MFILTHRPGGGVEGSVGPRAGLDFVEKREISYLETSTHTCDTAMRIRQAMKNSVLASITEVASKPD